MFFTKLFPSAAFVFRTRATLYLDDSELKTLLLKLKSASLAGTSSLLNCHKLLDVSEQLSLYSVKLYKHIINFHLARTKWYTIFKCNICTISCIYCYISYN